MSQHTLSSSLTFPHAKPPAPGTMVEIVPGLMWLRLALPYRLDHVNVYLIDDGDGWALLDTGIDDAPTRAAWETLLAGPLRERPLSRVLVTHYHPDHIGLAGWLCERLELAAVDQRDRLSRQPHHPSRPRRAQRRALPQLLPLPRPRCRRHRAPAHQRPPLSAHGVEPAAHVPPSDRGRAPAPSAPAASRCSPAAATRPSR